MTERQIENIKKKIKFCRARLAAEKRMNQLGRREIIYCRKLINGDQEKY